MADIIDGRAAARGIEDELRARITAMLDEGLPRPGLAVILVGEDPASAVYVGQKMKACERVGIASFVHRLPDDISEEALLALIERLNGEEQVHGILCQVPLPDHIETRLVQQAIAPAKDVDGFHPLNVGRQYSGGGGMAACTPRAIITLLERELGELAGLDAVVIGRSNIVGRPVAMMLVDRGATVTIAHSRTRDLAAIARRTDIIVAAAGVPELVRGDWVKDGAVVIDVGISRQARADGGTRLVGDVALDEVGHARAITPVPGGVGPMTIAMLLANTVTAAAALPSGASVKP